MPEPTSTSSFDEQVVRAIIRAAMSYACRVNQESAVRCADAARLLAVSDLGILDATFGESEVPEISSFWRQFMPLSERKRRELIGAARFSLSLEDGRAVEPNAVVDLAYSMAVVLPATGTQDVKLFPVPAGRYYDLPCPACGRAIYRVHSDHEDVIGGGHWLRDGDTIPYLYDELSEEQRHLCHDYELLVGSRGCCGTDYFVFECYLLNHEFGSTEADFHYLEEHKYNDGPTFRAVYVGGDAAVPREWLAAAVASPEGTIYKHVFGPFLMTDNLIGPFGVAGVPSGRNNHWRWAADVLKYVWGDLCALADSPDAGRALGAEAAAQAELDHEEDRVTKEEAQQPRCLI